MTVNRGPGVRQIGAVGTTPKEHRLAIAGQYAENAPGVPRSGLLVQGAVNVVTATAATGTLTYSVAPLAAVIARTVAEGVYTPTTTGTSTVNTTAAPASGSRWDLIWIKQNDQEKGDADNEAILGVTNGASSATPSRPTGSVPAGALVIAEAQIFSGTTSTTAAPNTMTQVFPITAARGGTIPVRSLTERATITAPALSQTVARLDLPSAPLQVWSGARWDGPPMGQLARVASSGILATGTTANNPVELNVQIEANRKIKISATVRGTSNKVGAVITYWVRYGGTNGSTTGSIAGDQHNKPFVQTTTQESATFAGDFTNVTTGTVRISFVAIVIITDAVVTYPAGGIVLTVEDMGPA